MRRKKRVKAIILEVGPEYRHENMVLLFSLNVLSQPSLVVTDKSTLSIDRTVAQSKYHNFVLSSHWICVHRYDTCIASRTTLIYLSYQPLLLVWATTCVYYRTLHHVTSNDTSLSRGGSCVALVFSAILLWYLINMKAFVGLILLCLLGVSPAILSKWHRIYFFIHLSFSLSFALSISPPPPFLPTSNRHYCHSIFLVSSTEHIGICTSCSFMWRKPPSTEKDHNTHRSLWNQRWTILGVLQRSNNCRRFNRYDKNASNEGWFNPTIDIQW